MTLEEQLTAAEAKLAEQGALLEATKRKNTEMEERQRNAESARNEESASVTQLQSELKALRQQNQDALAKIAELTAASKTAEAKAAEICASVGVTPLAVTAQGDAVAATSTDLVEELRKQETPAAQTAFWRKNKSKILSR